MEGFPWDDLRRILHGGQRMANVHSGEEILPKFESFNPLSRVHQLYRHTDKLETDRQTDTQADLRQQRPERNVVTFG